METPSQKFNRYSPTFSRARYVSLLGGFLGGMVMYRIEQLFARHVDNFGNFIKNTFHKQTFRIFIFLMELFTRLERSQSYRHIFAVFHTNIIKNGQNNKHRK